MRLPINVFTLWLTASHLAGAAAPAGPVEIWSAQITPAGAAALPGQLARIDALAKTLPPELAPAVRYQKIFLSILNGSAENTWSEDVRRLADAPGDNGLTRALRDVGKTWVARLEMAQIAEALRGFYRKEIRFPESLALVEADIPKPVRTDPWGEPWIYKVQAPEDFSTLQGQSFQLGPTRFPKLSLLRNARGNRKVNVPAWKVRPVSAGGSPALEFRSAASTALIQAGGTADGCALLYIGQNWALMAQVDQLFTINF